MQKFSSVTVITLFLVSVAFSQEARKDKNTDESPSSYSESSEYEIGKFTRDSKKLIKKKKSRKKVNPKKEAKRKAREKRRRAKALAKFEKRNRKAIKELSRRNNIAFKDEKPVAKKAGFVAIPVTIYDQNGKTLSDIREGEISAFENGVKQNVKRFGALNEPHTLILLVDISPSIYFKLEKFRSVLKEFVSKIIAKDRVMIVGFDQFLHILVEPTRDKKRANKAIDGLALGTGTSIYDSLSHLCETVIPRIGGRKSILLFSDGVDTTSKIAKFDHSINSLRRSNVSLSTIYYDSRKELSVKRLTIPGKTGIPDSVWRQILSTPGVLPRGSGTSKSEYRLGKSYVRELIFASGGRMFDANGKGKLNLAFEEAYKAISSQVYVEYISDQSVSDDAGRRIKVRVNRPNLNVHIRDAYF